jgi:hypothetical protein
MVTNGIHLSAIRNIKTLMGAFGFSDGSVKNFAVQTPTQQSIGSVRRLRRELLDS